MVDFLHVDPDDLLLDSFRLGRTVYESGFRPKHMISIWRGGTPIGLGVDAYFRFQGLNVHHTSIATSSYQGIGVQREVIVKGLEHLVRSVCPEDGLLIIDDVFESGRTIEAIVRTLRERSRLNAPADIRVAAVHRKPGKNLYKELPVISLHDLPDETWIAYPHEIAELLSEEDPEEKRIAAKSPEVSRILAANGFEPGEETIEGPYRYVTATELLHDSLRLGVHIAKSGYEPDFLIALWPGGVCTGLAVHEVYKYLLRKQGRSDAGPDHVPLNTTKTHLSYKMNVLGLDYLSEHVEAEHDVLIIDTTFRSGRLASDVVTTLKEMLRRNIELRRVKLASVYWNPDDDSTWISRPFRRRPDFYLRKVDQYVVYPYSPHRLANPRKELPALNPGLAEILFG